MRWISHSNDVEWSLRPFCKDVSSASVVDVAVDPWRFDHQSNGSRAEAHEDGSSLSKGPLEMKQMPPEIDFVLLTDPQKSAST